MVLDDIRSYAVAVDNQLQSVAMRHQKLVELALANRRQELSNLIKVPTSANVQKSKIDLYADADKQLEQEKSIVFMKSRDKIVNETKSVLKQQEEHVAGMIAKHMVISIILYRLRFNLNMQCEILPPMLFLMKL